MSRGRSELEVLGRDELLAYARKLGISNPELTTRIELVEEILRLDGLDDHDRRLSKSLLGKARDLVARVMDLGLHLPEAAQRLRPVAPVKPVPEPEGPRPIATVSLAQLYAAQGHADQALGMLDEILRRDPSHTDAQRLRLRLLATQAEPAADAPAPPMDQLAIVPAPTPSPVPAADDLRLERDAHGHMRCFWQLRPSSYATRCARLKDGHLVVRVIIRSPGSPEPVSREADVPIAALSGSCALPSTSEADTVCAAVGLSRNEQFEIIAVARSI